MQEAALFCFGRFTLDPAQRRLYADGVPLPLGATDFGVLLALVESAGTFVTKENLVSRVWRHAAVSDNTLYVHINTLRKILGDDYIVNKQGHGYRFVAGIQRTRKHPLSSLDKRQAGNLPSLRTAGPAARLSRLIGRNEQLRVASKLLARNRLVTLTGPGGVGKTTLALHVASKNGSNFPDGVWLVELASLKHANLVPGAAATALCIDIGGNAKPLTTLARHLAQASLLIVLDNCEHVIGAAAILCEAILRAAPGVKILATSREPLACSEEQVFEVPPLALPRDDATQPKAIRGAAAVELFVERAISADANFRMTDRDAPIAASICRRVDGLPLAIEMVAGWAGVLGLETLYAKLDGSLEGWLLPRKTMSPRHSTLRATLEWSHDLLSPAEQTVLRRLAVFAGSFDMQAAEAVAGDENIPNGQVFEHVASLMRKSMLAVSAGSRVQRYRLLETTRAFMADKLASSDDYKATRQRHVNYVLRVLENAMADWETTSDAVWQESYWPIIDDLHDALDWAMGVESDDAVALAGSSWPLWRESSLHVEGRQRLSAAAARLRPGTPPKLEAELRRGLGDLWLDTAVLKAAEVELERAARLYRALGDLPRLGSVLARQAFTFLASGRLEAAEQSMAEALRLIPPARYPRMLATTYSTQLCIEASLGRFAAARAAGERALSLCNIAGADRAALTVAANLLETTLLSGDVDGAILAGRNIAARLRDTSHSYLRGHALGVLAAALTERGDLGETLTTAREATPLLRDEGMLFWLLDHLALRSGLAGRTMDAALLAGHADAVHRKNDRPRWPMGCRAVDRLSLLLRDALPGNEIARLAELGAQLSEDQAMTLALSV